MNSSEHFIAELARLSGLRDSPQNIINEVRSLEWISVKDQVPDRKEPVIYCHRKNKTTWHVGIAYWTVSKTWNPQMNSEQDDGFTHWLPLPSNPPKEAKS